MNRLEGKIAIITGANSGVGEATAIKFAAEGAKVVITARRAEPLLAVAKKIEEAGGEVLAIPSDISKVEDAKKVVAMTLEKFGKIDILINNAGVLDEGLKAIDKFTDDDMNRVIDINTKGTMCMMREVTAEMAKTAYGSIVNVASVAGVYGNANMAPYSMTKGALISFTKALAKEVTASGITVNAISPGSVSPTVDFDIDFVQDSELAFLGRTGSTAENADLICFLASDNAAYISGQNIQIDGCRKKM